MNFIQLHQKDLKDFRYNIWIKNNKICPILKVEISEDEVVGDHNHKLKSEPISENKGTYRDSISRKANSIEGKFINYFKRMFGSDEEKWVITPQEFLRNLADYYDKGSFKDDNGDCYIHPNEKPREPLLKKSSYNKLKKLYTGKAKFPSYPKSKKMTKKLRELFSVYEVDVEFYK